MANFSTVKSRDDVGKLNPLIYKTGAGETRCLISFKI